MKLSLVAGLWVWIFCANGSEGASLPTVPVDLTLIDMDAYSFEQFLSDFGRSYHDPSEYAERRGIFYDNLRTIVEHNVKHVNTIGGYRLGVNPTADQRPHELLRGYDKYQSSTVAITNGASNDGSSHQTTAASERKLRNHAIHPDRVSRVNKHHWKYHHHHHNHKHDAIVQKLGIHLEPVEDLPRSVDWRTKGVTTPIKNQGMCGSCWAFASTAVLESHVAIQTGVLYDLSPQELVSCAPNREHCGGTGGCAGATAELAFDLVKTHGIVEEWRFGYQEGRGGAVNCTLNRPSSRHRFSHRRFYSRSRKDEQRFDGAVAGIADYAVLPSNNYTVLMNTVAKLGPVTVSVACLPWHLYKSGVFYEPLHRGQSTDLDHLVVMEGYGTDEESGEDYWIVRNSWGPRWGEKGYIRLKRVGSEECGIDETPEDGTACTLDPDGNKILPEPQLICGNSGILFDSAIPLGGFLI